MVFSGLGCTQATIVLIKALGVKYWPAPELPLLTRDGGFIRAGYRAELDESIARRVEQGVPEGLAKRVAALEGFGEKTQEKILAGIRNREAYNKRHLWIEAKDASDLILTGLRKPVAA